MKIGVSPIAGKENQFQCESFKYFYGPASEILKVAIFFVIVYILNVFLCYSAKSFQSFDGPAFTILTVVNPVQFLSLFF